MDVLGGFEENYSNKIKKYEEEGWLHYQGYQDDVRPFIEKCHCFVLPSWHEGMANTNLECAASGRPVITSNIHGCLEAVIDKKTGYLAEKKSADDLYKIMKKFIQLSYKERKEMGLAGRRHMEAVFDKRIVAIYSSMLNMIVARLYGYNALYYGSHATQAGYIQIIMYFFFPALVGYLISNEYSKKARIIVYVIFGLYTGLQLLSGDVKSRLQFP